MPITHVVSRLLPLFADTTNATALPPFGRIYSASSKVCTGDVGFVSQRSAAPADFCFHRIDDHDLRRVIGSEWWWPWESDVVQRWANVEEPNYDAEYDRALAAQVRNAGGVPLKWDQFALERICLARW
jgi:hypothetical protein